MISIIFATNKGLWPMPGVSLSTYDLLAQSLLAQTYLHQGGELEVICVDKYATLPRPELTHFLGDWARFFRPRETPWTKLNAFAAASARNTGLVHARGDVVVALDDCYEMSPRFLERIAVHAVAGRYVVPLLAGGLDRNPGGGRQQFGAPWHFDTGHHPGGIVSYPLATAIAINGYDERYDGCGAYEDIDFTARLELAGVRWERDDEVVATLHAPHGTRLAQPKCGLLVWCLNRDRRAAGGPEALRGNAPWTADELHAFETCGRADTPPKCWRTVQLDPHIGIYGGDCDYAENLNGNEDDEPAPARAVRLGLRIENDTIRGIRTDYETQPGFDLAAERAARAEE